MVNVIFVRQQSWPSKMALQIYFVIIFFRLKIVNKKETSATQRNNGDKKILIYLFYSFL